MANFKNIVGSGFPPYVGTQIQQRGKIISNNNRSNNTLQYLTNRNVWFRLSSAANINNEAKTAQLNVLQGGIIAAGGDKTVIKQGFNQTYSKGKNDDLGFKPMPGITNVSIGTGGKWQTLMQADIEFICYDLDQLDTMTKLYMSLGCNLFLEWGHSNYFRNDGTFEVNNSPIDFFSTNDKDLILKKATEKRKSTNGNYEAMLGRVHNFDWTANNDGSYNCKIQIMGPGAIVESLKINNANQVDFTIFKTLDDDAGDYSSNLENILTSYKEFFKKVAPPLEIILTGKKSSKEKKTKFAQIEFDKEIQFFTVGKGNSVVNKSLTYRQYLNSVFLSANYKGPVILGDKIINKNINIRYGNAHQIISGIQSPEAKLTPEGIINAINPSLYNGYISSQTINEEKNFSTYITLGHLFTLIQHIGIFVQNVDGAIKPIVYLDYNPSNTPIKTSLFQASIDPSKCLIPYNVSGETQNKFFDSILEDDNKLQEYNLLNSSIKTPKLPGFNNQLFNILINIDFALNTLKNLSSSNNKEVNLMDYITRILDGVNISLGKINSFRPFFDKDSDCIRIVDENKIISESESNKVIDIPNFGTNSLVYDFSFNTKISPQLSSQIVIAAQANKDDLKDFSEEVMTYQYLNRGVKDRLSKTKLPPVNPKINITSSEEIDKKPLIKLFKYFFNVYNNFENLSSNKISEMTNLYVDLQGRFEKNEIIDNIKNPTRAIPIEYSIKMDGISGILPYNAFRIPENRLPKQYRNNDGFSGIDFAIFSINHEIENNKWYTILRGQIITRN
jgi:hypothetical protein